MTARNRILQIALLALGSFSLAVGCGRTSIDSSRILIDSKLPRPHIVLVQDYDVGIETVKLDSSLGSKLVHAGSSGDGETDRQKLGLRAAKSLAEQLASDINALGLSAERSSGTLPQSGVPYLVIRGALLSVDEGNRLRRFVIGLGAGSSQVEAQTRVFMLQNGQEKLIEEFSVSSKSSRAPGAAETLGVGAAAGNLATAAIATGAQNVATGVGSKLKNTIGASVTADAARGAQAIAKELAKLFHTQGWIPPAKE